MSLNVIPWANQYLSTIHQPSQRRRPRICPSGDQRSLAGGIEFLARRLTPRPPLRFQFSAFLSLSFAGALGARQSLSVLLAKPEISVYPLPPHSVKEYRRNLSALPSLRRQPSSLRSTALDPMAGARAWDRSKGDPDGGHSRFVRGDKPSRARRKQRKVYILWLRPRPQSAVLAELSFSRRQLERDSRTRRPDLLRDSVLSASCSEEARWGKYRPRLDNTYKVFALHTPHCRILTISRSERHVRQLLANKNAVGGWRARERASECPERGDGETLPGKSADCFAADATYAYPQIPCRSATRAIRASSAGAMKGVWLLFTKIEMSKVDQMAAAGHRRIKPGRISPTTSVKLGGQAEVGGVRWAREVLTDDTSRPYLQVIMTELVVRWENLLGEVARVAPNTHARLRGQADFQATLNNASIATRKFYARALCTIWIGPGIRMDKNHRKNVLRQPQSEGPRNLRAASADANQQIAAGPSHTHVLSPAAVPPKSGPLPRYFPDVPQPTLISPIPPASSIAPRTSSEAVEQEMLDSGALTAEDLDIQLSNIPPYLGPNITDPPRFLELLGHQERLNAAVVGAVVGTAAQQMFSTGNSTAAEAIRAHGPKIQTKLGLSPSSSQITARKLDFKNQQRLWAPRLSKWSRQAIPLLLRPSVHTDPKSKPNWAYHPVPARSQPASWIFKINSGCGHRGSANVLDSPQVGFLKSTAVVGTAAQQMFSTDPKSKPNWAYQQANTQFEPDCSLQFGFLKSTAGVGTAAQQMFSTSNSAAAEAIRAHGPKIQTKLGLPASQHPVRARLQSAIWIFKINSGCGHRGSANVLDSSSQITARKLDFKNQQRLWAPRLSKWSRQAIPLLLRPSVHTDPKSKPNWAYHPVPARSQPASWIFKINSGCGHRGSANVLDSGCGHRGSANVLDRPSVRTDPKSKPNWAYQQANTQFEPDCSLQFGFLKSTAGVGTAAQQMFSTSNSAAAEAIRAHGPKIQTKLGLPASQHPVRARLQSAIWIFKINSGCGHRGSANVLDSGCGHRGSANVLDRPSVRTDPKSKPNWAYQQANTQFEPDCSLQFGFLKSTAGVGTAAQQMFSTSNSAAAEAIRAHGPKIQTKLGLPASQHPVRARLQSAIWIFKINSGCGHRGSANVLDRPSLRTDPKSKPNWAYQQANTQFEPDCSLQFGFLKSTAGVGTAAQQMFSTSNSAAAEAIRAHGPKIQTKLGLPASQHPVRARLQSAIWIFEINSGCGRRGSANVLDKQFHCC
ncbi:hypothetical protein DFH06DRAFT_1140290 [Mycena polygramma]|nr:hypothetical protein DFH06DRAFT_1140290 [Mycena polygramma]